MKELVLQKRLRHHPKKKEAERAQKKLRTIANRSVRASERKLTEENLKNMKRDFRLNGF
jgi:hypothetical protein